MNTAETVVQKQNPISSFFNSIWQKGNRVATILALLMTGILIGVAYYGLHRPHLQISSQILIGINIVTMIYVVLVSPAVAYLLASVFGIISIFSFACVFLFKNGADVFKIITFVFIFIAIIIASVKYLWDKNRKYLPLFVIFALIINTWSISSTLSKPDPNFDWFSRANGKIAGDVVIIPLGLMDLEDKYFPVAKLEPREIPAKISIFNPEVVGTWKKEEKFYGNLRVEFQPQNYEDYKVILEHGDFQQITVRATSIEEARRLVMKEVSSQSGLKPENITIIVNGIGS